MLIYRKTKAIADELKTAALEEAEKIRIAQKAIEVENHAKIKLAKAQRF